MAIYNIEPRDEADKEYMELMCDSSADVANLPTTGVATGSPCIVNGVGVYIFNGTSWALLNLG